MEHPQLGSRSPWHLPHPSSLHPTTGTGPVHCKPWEGAVRRGRALRHRMFGKSSQPTVFPCTSHCQLPALGRAGEPREQFPAITKIFPCLWICGSLPNNPPHRARELLKKCIKSHKWVLHSSLLSLRGIKHLIPFDFLILIPLLGTVGTAGNGTGEELCTSSGELSSGAIAGLPATALLGSNTPWWLLGPSQIFKFGSFSLSW